MKRSYRSTLRAVKSGLARLGNTSCLRPGTRTNVGRVVRVLDDEHFATAVHASISVHEVDVYIQAQPQEVSITGQAIGA